MRAPKRTPPGYRTCVGPDTLCQLDDHAALVITLTRNTVRAQRRESWFTNGAQMPPRGIEGRGLQAAGLPNRVVCGFEAAFPAIGGTARDLGHSVMAESLGDRWPSRYIDGGQVPERGLRSWRPFTATMWFLS